MESDPLVSRPVFTLHSSRLCRNKTTDETVALETAARDVEAFAKYVNVMALYLQCFWLGPTPNAFTPRHAGRSTVDAADVMLLARRNEGLEELLRKALKDNQAG